MPGNLIFKPIQCQLTISNSKASFQDPYVVAKLGDQEVKSHRAKMEGETGVWADGKNNLEIRTNYESTVHFDIRDADKKEPDDTIGDFKIDLDVLETKEHSTEWYDVYNKNKLIGKIQVESIYKRDKGQGIQGMAGNKEKPQFMDGDRGYSTSSNSHSAGAGQH